MNVEPCQILGYASTEPNTAQRPVTAVQFVTRGIQTSHQETSTSKQTWLRVCQFEYARAFRTTNQIIVSLCRPCRHRCAVRQRIKQRISLLTLCRVHRWGLAATECTRSAQHQASTAAQPAPSGRSSWWCGHQWTLMSCMKISSDPM